MHSHQSQWCQQLNGDRNVVRLEYVQPNAGTWGTVLNFIDGNNDDIILHFSLRMSENVSLSSQYLYS